MIRYPQQARNCVGYFFYLHNALNNALKKYFYPHFIDGKAESHRLSNLTKCHTSSGLWYW